MSTKISDEVVIQVDEQKIMISNTWSLSSVVCFQTDKHGWLIIAATKNDEEIIRENGISVQTTNHWIWNGGGGEIGCCHVYSSFSSVLVITKMSRRSLVVAHPISVRRPSFANQHST